MESQYQLIKVHGRDHVVKDQEHERRSMTIIGEFRHPDANYLNTGRCLCGVLNKGETLDEWIIRREIIREKFNKE